MNWPKGLKKTAQRVAVLGEFTRSTKALSVLSVQHRYTVSHRGFVCGARGTGAQR
jgi:hypothetical protein